MKTLDKDRIINVCVLLALAYLLFLDPLPWR